MRKHGWQLPYHPLQVLSLSFSFFVSCFNSLCFWSFYVDFCNFLVKVVAVAVFLALGFAFYVFFAPFVGKKIFQYIIMGIYTPLVSHFTSLPLVSLCVVEQFISGLNYWDLCLVCLLIPIHLFVSMPSIFIFPNGFPFPTLFLLLIWHLNPQILSSLWNSPYFRWWGNKLLPVPTN